MTNTIPSKASKVCPECGIPVDHINVIGHALSHWNEYLDPMKTSKEALKRQKQLLAGGVSREEYEKTHNPEA